MSASTTSLAIRLPLPLGRRLAALAKKTGRTKTYYATEAIARHLEEIEDIRIAQHRLSHPGRRHTLKEAKAALGLDD